jgi:hypothetical protein
MLLDRAKEWQPFKLDALGLVTILGTAEMDRTIGCPNYNRCTEYLPLLAGFIIAGNNFTAPLPGFTVYNITDGIVATDVAGWFARWLMCQNFKWNASTLHIAVNAKNRFRFLNQYVSILIGLVILSPMMFIAVFTGDWFGTANVSSMLISVFVRWLVVKQNREAIDRTVLAGMTSSSQVVKTFWTLPNGKAIAIYAPRGIIDCF